MTKTADIVVIGGGIVGAACAERLSRDFGKVVLLERSGLASGTSSACQSGVGHGIFADDYDLDFDRAAIAAYRAMVGEGVDLGFVLTRALLVCRPAEQDAVKARINHLAAHGLHCEWLDDGDLRHKEPCLAGDYAGALRLNDMGQVSPMHAVTELARRAHDRGAAIRTGVAVTGIAVEHGRVVAVHTGAGTISTGHAVIAAGAWSRAVGAFAGISLPVWPLKGHVLVTEPLPGFVRHYLTEAEYEVAAHFFTATEMTPDGPRPGDSRTAAVLQPLPSGQILIGSSREFGADREVDRGRLCEIARRAIRLVPGLAARRIIRTYAGLRPWTPDGRPLVGPTRMIEGLSLATGHAGEGNTRALITARIIGDLLTGRPPPIDPAPLSPDRFDLHMAKAA